MAMPKTDGRDYQYEVRVAGKKFFTGDSHSTGVLVGNLCGRNFDRKENPRAEHQNWLKYMASEYGMPLPFGASVTLLSPEGEEVCSETIGGLLV
jgi:hypothetical protein